MEIEWQTMTYPTIHNKKVVRQRLFLFSNCLILFFNILSHQEAEVLYLCYGFMKNSSEMNEEYLFDKKLFEQLDFQQVTGIFSPPITSAAPGDHLIVRPLSTHDFDKGFIKLLGQLTDAGQPTKQQFLDKFKAMKSCPNTYFVTVIEDLRTNEIIGAATLFVEHKFIHGCSKRGHLEDVVVNNTYRGKQLGKLIVVTVTLLAKFLGCYKMSLECKDKLIPFYTSLGFKLEPGNSNSMVQRFNISTS